MTRKRQKAQRRRTGSRATTSPRRAAAPPPSRNERALRERILEFTYQQRFAADMDRALRLYFGQEALQDGELALDETEIPGFQEWYIHDYVTSEGERIIDLFAGEMGPRLPAAQRHLLDDWRRVNRCRLFEVQEVKPGIGVTVQDLLNGEVLQVKDISSSHSLRKWHVLLARPLLTEGRLCFTGSMVPLSPLQKPALLKCARGLWDNHRVQHPQASLDDFYRDHSLDLLHCQAEILSAPPPSHYTPEGHSIAPCTARYTVADPRAVEDLLDEAEEFIYVGLAAEDETALAYVWLLTGRSHVPEVPVAKGVIHRTEWISESGELSYRSLGDVRLWPGKLELLCLSKERLEAGKALLNQIVGHMIRHVRDEYRDLEDSIASAEDSPSSRPLPQVDPATDRRMREKVLEKWLATPMRNLDGRSPREAARDPAMREALEEMFKAMEYIEEQKRRNDEPYFDVADVRRKLGLAHG